jgi:tetratricopeptide (TPR) repeat protein
MPHWIRLHCLGWLLVIGGGTFAPALAGPQETDWDKYTSAGRKAVQDKRYEEAEKQFKVALREAEKLKPDGLTLAQSLRNLADVYKTQGKYADAEALCKRYLAILEKVLGPELPEVAGGLNDLSGLYYAEGKYAAAEPLLKRSLAILEKVLGPEQPEVAKSLNNLATLYYAESKYAEAEPLLKRSLMISEKALGPEDPLVATCLSNLAELYRIEGKYAEAEPLAKRSLMIREKALGPEHPDVTDSLSNLALVYQDEGKYAEAEPLYKRALAIDEKALGPEHPGVAVSLNNLAGLYRDEGKYAEAEPLYKRALAIDEKALGPEYPGVANMLNNLAELYRDEGKYAEAEPLHKRSLEIYEKALGPESRDLATSLGNLAELYRAEGKYAEAEPLYKRSLEIYEKTLGLEHRDVASSLNNLGELYRAEGKYAEAEPLYKRSLEINEKTLGPEHPEVASSLHNLAELYNAEGKYAEAEPLYKRSLAILEKALGPEHPNVATSLGNLARLYQDEGKHVEAEPLLKRSLMIREKALGSEHPDVAISLNKLALLYYAEGRPEQADSFFDRSLRNYASQFGYLFPYMTEKERLSFLNTFLGVFPVYYSFCFQYGKQDPALIGKMYDVVLWQKGFVGRSVAATRAKIAASNDKEALSLFEKLTAKRSQLAALLFSKPTDQTQWKQRVDQLTQEANGIEAELLKRSRSLAEEKKMPQVTWKDVQGTLKPREAAVELVRFRFHDRKQWTDKTYYVALIVTTETKSAPALVSLGEAEDLEDVPLMKYRDLSSEHSVNARPDDSVFRSLWQPMESALGTAQRIYLSPDGVLNLVSFPVLPIGHERRLMDKYDLRVVSSTKDLVREGSSTASKSAVLIGDPQFDLTEAQQRAALQKVSPGSSESGSFVASGTSGLRSQELREGKKLAALPGSKAEIASIRSLLQKQGWWVDVYTQESATEESIQRLQGPRLLHVATHAFFLSDQAEIFSKTSPRLPPGFEDPMLRSGLFFAGANRVLQGEKPAEDLEDGILTAYEATDLNLQGTELVVLSACETGLGKIGNGEGVFGLRRALEEAGAQAVLMSLWAVPDRETQELMTLFYGKWLAGEDKQQALHDAEMELRATVKARYGEDRPFYWGGFVLVGR